MKGINTLLPRTNPFGFVKQPLVVHSHRKWNHHDGSAPLARLRISEYRQDFGVNCFKTMF